MTAQTFDGFLLTRQWRDTSQGVELEFWFSTHQGPLCVTVTAERPVFFLSADSRAQAEEVLAAARPDEVKPLALRDFSLSPVVGLYFKQYRAARRAADRLREAGMDPLEADINPADRFLMERFISGSARLVGEPVLRDGTYFLRNPAVSSVDYRPQLKVVSYDIETAMSGIQLYSIAVHARSKTGEERRVFMIGEGATQDYVEVCADQEHLLQAFIDWVEWYDPDVLIGWNVINFDTRYLQRVADHLERRLLLGRERQPGHWREQRDYPGRYKVQFPGRVILDGIELLRAAFYRFESFSLQNVATQILGEGKLLHGGDRGEEITRQFHHDKTSLAKYNLKDCELVSDIFAATGLMEFAVARSVITGLDIDRMGGSVASFDNVYLPLLHRSHYVAPNASKALVASPGGFVLDSTPGIFDHVLVLDFKSLYPSIIRTFRVDPLGLALGVSAETTEQQTVPGYIEARFAREGHILPDLIEQLWQRRDAAKAAADEPLSQAIKIIMNSFYGVLGSPGCRFFDARLATSITRRGHDILQQTRDYIEAAGYSVIYGDTDSVFVWVSDARSDDDAVMAGKTLQNDLNAWWKGQLWEQYHLESALELEFETHYKRFLMPTMRGSEIGSKKRYAGVVSSRDGDEVVFKGLENVRTDWTRLARDFQEKLYTKIFHREPFEHYVKKVTAGVVNGDYDEDLVYRKRLRRNLDDYQRNVPPHVQAARRCEERGLPTPGRGDWVEYVITTMGAEPAAKPLAPLDYQQYVDRQLEPIADGILGFVGASFKALTEQQMDLF
ncbi:MAG: DNA polymerase II [Halioglobus sp.]